MVEINNDQDIEIGSQTYSGTYTFPLKNGFSSTNSLSYSRSDFVEFEDDLKRFKYIKRLLRRYYDTGVLKERLLLNHLIVLNNVFSMEAATTLLLYKIQPTYWPALKSFLIYLNSISDNELKEIEHDKNVLETLGKI